MIEQSSDAHHVLPYEGNNNVQAWIRPLRVLVACEYSGTVRDAFRALGHDAMSCDFLDTEIPGPHHKGDVREILADGWDLMIGHPTCTYLTNSGVCWLHKDGSRWARLDEAAQFFNLLWDSPIPFIALENPIMHKYARERVRVRHSQIVQPWMFGHREKKATCFWLKGLPPLVPTTNLKAETDALPKNIQQRLHYLSPSSNRWKERSRTFAGIASAMAAQWGKFVKSKKEINQKRDGR